MSELLGSGSLRSGVLPKMYTELAEWWPYISHPADYAEEAEIYRRTLLGANENIHTVLELGSGGGNNASFLKQHFEMTLVDLSPGMLANSRRLNPELPHIQGDMRSVRLGKTFDAVFIHDAIMYMTSEEDLFQAIQTAAAHLGPGGVVLIVPDHVKETYHSGTSLHGHDGAELGPEYTGRDLHYMEWTYDPDPSDSTYLVDFVYLIHEPGQPTRCIYDQHVFGIFSEQTWLELLRRAGFEGRLLPFEHSEVEPGSTEMILGVKK